jgi:general L-amino acid transport system permease protein
MSATDQAGGAERRASAGRQSLLQNERVRGVAIQIVAAVAVVAAFVFLAHNTVVNIHRLGQSLGFDFLSHNAGFDISITLIPYDLRSSNLRVFAVGVVNTLVLSAIGIVLATVIGFVVGIARLSRNFLIAKLAAAYVDILRNIPLLAQIIFWYFGVLTALPSVRQSLDLSWGEKLIFINSRGLYMPAPIAEPGFWVMPAALLAGIIAAVLVHRWARRRQALTGQQFPSFWTGLAFIIGLPVLVSLAGGPHLTWSVPVLKGFNFAGGMAILPEFVALLLALSVYTGAFIAEIVRGGIQAVSQGQTEAASALGLSTIQTTRLVILPQALRIIVPPLTSQYLNLTKNSSLAVAIGYPDLVNVFMGTVQNQTGHPVETIAMTMAFYLVISLLISLFMNWYNRRIALVER